MIHHPNSTQICETVDEIIDYFSKNPLISHNFARLPPCDKSKNFSEILKTIQSSPKNYKLKTFVQDLSFLIQSFLNINNILESPLEKHLIPYIISSLFYEISEFKSMKNDGNLKENLVFFFTNRTKLSNYLIFYQDLLNEDQELMDLAINLNAFEIVENLWKILQQMIEIVKKYDISEILGYFNDIIQWIFKIFKTFLCEKNLIIVNKLIKNDIFESFVTFFACENTEEKSLEILILLVKYGSIEPNFLFFMSERRFLCKLARINPKIDFLIEVLSMNFAFEFPSFGIHQ